MNTASDIELHSDWQEWSKDTLEPYRQRMAFLAQDILGVEPPDVDFQFVASGELVERAATRFMPRQYHSWYWGNKALKLKEQHSAAPLYGCVNSDPLILYLPEQSSVATMAQALAEGWVGRGIVYRLNQNFQDCSPGTVVEEFAQHQSYVEQLALVWTRQGVDLILDALHAINYYCGKVPKVELKADEEVRAGVLERLTQLRIQLAASGDETLRQPIAELEKLLVQNPLRPTSDFFAFIIDPFRNPGVPEELRNLASIVRRQSRYFLAQDMTALLTEGFARFIARRILDDPRLELSTMAQLDLCKLRAHVERRITNQYFNRDVLGQRLFEYVFEQYGMSRILQIVREYDDKQFLLEFLDDTLFQRVNEDICQYVRSMLGKVNAELRTSGWHRVVADLSQTGIEPLIDVVSKWAELAEAAQTAHERTGTPLFPVDRMILRDMSTVLQVVASYDQEPDLTKLSLIRHFSMDSIPTIVIFDDGSESGFVQMKHILDSRFGPMVPREASDVTKLFRRLITLEIKLFTMEPRSQQDQTLEEYVYQTQKGSEEVKGSFVSWVAPVVVQEWRCGCEG